VVRKVNSNSNSNSSSQHSPERSQNAEERPDDEQNTSIEMDTGKELPLDPIVEFGHHSLLNNDDSSHLDNIDENEPSEFESGMFTSTSNSLGNGSNLMLNANSNSNSNANSVSFKPGTTNVRSVRSLRFQKVVQAYDETSSSSIARRIDRMRREGVANTKKQEDKYLEFTRWGGRNQNQSVLHILNHLDDRDDSDEESEQEEENEPSEEIIHHSSRRKVNVIKRAKRRVRKRIKGVVQPLLPEATKSYEELLKDDKHRERVADNCEDPFYKLPFHFRGTVLKVISTDILFWSTLIVFIVIRYQIRSREIGEGEVFDYKNLSSNLVYVGGFMTFFLVFYVNQNHVRYFGLHKDVMTLMGRVNDVATLSKASLPMERARRIVRFMNTAHVCCFTGLSGNYSLANFLDPLDTRFALLTDDEYDRIAKEIDVERGPKAVFELLTWVMVDIRDAKDHGCIDSMESYELRRQVLTFRSTVAKIFVTCTRPIPFFYVHFLALLTAFYCPLFAVVSAFQTGGSDVELYHDAISLLVVILQSLFTIGLRILGQQLSDPFGGELIDLQIARYVNMILNGSNQILAAKRLPPPSLKTEKDLKSTMVTIGKEYEDDDDETMDNF